MRRSIKKDSKYRQAFKKFEVDNLLNKVLLRETLLTKNIQLANKFSITSKVKIKNKCIFTGRCKSIYSFFRLSRIAFKEEASFGRLEGVSKSSW